MPGNSFYKILSDFGTLKSKTKTTLFNFCLFIPFPHQAHTRTEMKQLSALENNEFMDILEKNQKFKGHLVCPVVNKLWK